ncbi:MAG: tRNA (N6-threonylcarbamoyladenosine(37)-N6)-methyltransferase TrmO [Candidatus Bathyarchaeota archaeon]|nr:tRNA (N6-threonylcarbamoyladenosine(37)-N6)-methyltransferase TrmO [Candidatus Bathyarchaeota archaeon]
MKLSPSKKMHVKPIGYVKRESADEDVKDKSLMSMIVIKKELEEALDGLEEFSHLLVISWLHKIVDTGEYSLKTHPRGRLDLPLTGVFATRSPKRPNPIGLTLVKLVKRERNILWVEGLDAFHDTPVLDVKPFDRWDTVESFRVSKWMPKNCK